MLRVSFAIFVLLTTTTPAAEPVRAAVEKVISPLCKHIGFRTDLALSTVLEGTSLQVARKEKVNPLRFWHLVECVNKKTGSAVPSH